MSEHYGLEVREPTAGEIRLLVSGEVDLEASSTLLDSILCAGLALAPGHRVVVDLQSVTFIDSSGLSALVEANNRLTRQEQSLVLGNLSDRVRRILSVTGLDQVIPIEASPVEQPRAS